VALSVVHRVDLPRGAEPRVEAGSRVEPGDVVAEWRTPAEAVAVPVAAPLRLPPERAAAALTAKPGASLARGEPIARSRRREVRAPSPSLFLGWDRTDGSALIAPLTEPRPIHGHVRGRVASVEDDAIAIDVEGAVVDGVAGSGGAVHGTLQLAVREPADELRAAAIDVASAGRILVGGSRASAEALIRARAIGVAGLVLGGVLDKELRDFEATQARRRELGSAPDRGLAILILAGYGKRSIDPALFAWLQAQDGRLASLFGAGRRLYVYEAPQPPAQRPLAGRGDRVIGNRQPHAGVAGRIVRIIDDLQAAASGVTARSAVVRFDDGRVAVVPLPNLDAVEP
jgi:hypothetical protein